MNTKQVEVVNTPEVSEQLKNDPFLTLWKNNYNENQSKGYLSNNKTRPLLYIKNTKPYAHKPVVIVAAGPSLDKNIHLLKEYQNNCVILCADVTLFKLLQNDIKPDFVVNIDPSDSLRRYWVNLDTTNLTLVCPTTVSSRTLETWRGNVYFFNQSDVAGSPKGNLLKKLIKPTEGWGVLFNRYFVGATMFQFLTYLSPSVVILIGHDFGYTDNKAFCDGFLDLKIHHDEHPVGSPEHTYMLEKLKKEEIKKDVLVKISPTESIGTSNALHLYKNTLLELIRAARLPVINSTEGGIMTEIAKMSFKDSLERFCKNPINKFDTFAMQKRKHKRR